VVGESKANCDGEPSGARYPSLIPQTTESVICLVS